MSDCVSEGAGGISSGPLCSQHAPGPSGSPTRFCRRRNWRKLTRRRAGPSREIKATLGLMEALSTETEDKRPDAAVILVFHLPFCLAKLRELDAS
ncbi:hypothetical protein EYF80_063256 [Liparis tanakae]|uniref:Uncharacterized protein n=1 Tax=Liparis tanakae TaxID=230148 RepID=A0A4Z2ECW4_9TELE|nr:hypothetical protein EYF80_063256 [Liparis tanakae]